MARWLVGRTDQEQCTAIEADVKRLEERRQVMRRELDTLLGDSPLGAPEDLPAAFQEGELEAAFAQAIHEADLELDEPPQWDCAEFPCVLTLTGDLSQEHVKRLARALPEEYLGEDVAFRNEVWRERAPDGTSVGRVTLTPYPKGYQWEASSRLERRLDPRLAPPPRDRWPGRQNDQ